MGESAKDFGVNYAKRAADRVGYTGREIDLSGAKLDYRRDRVEPAPVPEGFIDLSESLRGGIYILAESGTIVYIGYASASMLEAIAAKAGPQPRFLPNIRFDQILIRRCHPDRAKPLLAELIATYRPRYNLPAPQSVRRPQVVP